LLSLSWLPVAETVQLGLLHPTRESHLLAGEELPRLGLAELPRSTSGEGNSTSVRQTRAKVPEEALPKAPVARETALGVSFIPSQWVASQRFREFSWRSSWAQRVNIRADRARLAKDVGHGEPGY
jgi:hypothetical protein